MRALKLVAVKNLINSVVPMLERLVPRTKPQRPACRLTRRLFQLLRKGLKLHPERFYADKNFPKLLRALERSLVFIAEEDGHYAGWLAESMLLVHDLVEETRPEFPPGPRGDAAWIRWASRQGITKIKRVA